MTEKICQTHDCFSYKHFYVLYCKFWLLDQDHDLIVSQNDMLQYNNQMLTSRITARVMKYGKIMAFPRDTQVLSDKDDSTLTYMDFICKLSEWLSICGVGKLNHGRVLDFRN
jgi:serine/threonine-protein phosphatase 2A regulatory subunit B''